MPELSKQRQLNATDETVAWVPILGAQDSTIDSTVEQPGFARGLKAEFTGALERLEKKARLANKYDGIRKRISKDSLRLSD